MDASVDGLGDARAMSCASARLSTYAAKLRLRCPCVLPSSSCPSQTSGWKVALGEVVVRSLPVPEQASRITRVLGWSLGYLRGIAKAPQRTTRESWRDVTSRLSNIRDVTRLLL